MYSSPTPPSSLLSPHHKEKHVTIKNLAKFPNSRPHFTIIFYDKQTNIKYTP